MRTELREFLHKPVVNFHSPDLRGIAQNFDAPVAFEPPFIHLTEFIGDPQKLPRGVTCVGVVGGLAPEIVLYVHGERQLYRVSEAKYQEVLKLNVPYFEP